MEVIYTLIPGMMLFGMLFFAVLIWAVKKGQYEDMEGNASRILLDDDDGMVVLQPKELRPENIKDGDPKKPI